MTKAEVSTLVDRGLAIRAEIAKLETELDGINIKLKAEGYEANKDGKVEDLKDATREGKRWLALGSERILPVVFTTDLLAGSFTANRPLHKKIEEAAGAHLNDFYKRCIKYENRFDSGVKFRKTAADLLGDSAPAFITACLARDKNGIPKSDVKIEWDKTEVKVAA